jgi:hypothetical protein
MSEPDEETLQVYCHDCNVLVHAAVIGQHVDSRLVQPGNELEDGPYYVTVYKFAVCRKCKSPFLYQEDYYEIPGEVSALQGEQLLYPGEREFLGEGLPETVRRAHQNARRSYAAGLYEPCVIMCRKCLEAACYELGETRGGLQNRLEALRQKRFLDSKLLDWANGLRMIGNDAAHELDAQIDQADAIDSLEFIEAILLYAFSLNARYEEFQRRRAGLPKG